MPQFFSTDYWLEETLGRSVFQLVSTQFDLEILKSEMLSLSLSKDAFFYAKLPTTNVEVCFNLTRAGFSVVDTGITLAWAGMEHISNSDIIVSPVKPNQHQAVMEIAERCFRWSRFHLDHNFTDKVANRIKRCWIESYCSGERGAILYVGLLGESIAGFLAVIEYKLNNQKVAVIDLVGVAPEFQRSGVGAAMLQYFINQWQGRVNELRVGTQAANIQSLRFYEQNNFRIIESHYCMHAHAYKGKIFK